MGVYIKGMEMPESCYYCPFADGVWQKDKRCLINGKEMPRDGRDVQQNHINCPLIELPPHGRLGDLDKLAEKIEGIWDCNDLYFQPNDQICDPEDCKGCKWRETWDCFRRMVNHAPTIIPAEEGK